MTRSLERYLRTGFPVEAGVRIRHERSLPQAMTIHTRGRGFTIHLPPAAGMSLHDWSETLIHEWMHCRHWVYDLWRSDHPNGFWLDYGRAYRGWFE